MSDTRYKPDIEHDLLDAARILDTHPSEVYALNATCRRAVEAIRTARSEGFAAGAKEEREAIVHLLKRDGSFWLADAIERADHLPKESKGK